MVGGGDIVSMSCTKSSPHKEQIDNSIRGMGEEKVKTLLSANMGLFGESQCSNFKKAEAWAKDCGLCFSGICFS